MIRRLFKKMGRKSSKDRSAATESLSEAAEKLQEQRGNKLSPQPADHGPTHEDNIAAAAKDYGFSRFSGETDAIEKTKSYRPSKKRRS